MASNDGDVRVCPKCDTMIVEDSQLSPNVNICPECGYDMGDGSVEGDSPDVYPS